MKEKKQYSPKIHYFQSFLVLLYLIINTAIYLIQKLLGFEVQEETESDLFGSTQMDSQNAFCNTGTLDDTGIK